ncbi:DUF808 domain-containing protein [Paucibacter sp. APW11]|uniref:DUF808 domain-containing protein n=1 Tax=Roseateles aquae TaxID=3077235 RepID=A0ABU3PEN3_9BURK|nr:DUF808 domain-containing protein [Paucibacter sp. APW11]MDT9000607.1 DUF808 domain-containing protein [Paucibacter sp. APW11]
MASALFALLDDIATLLDDVALLSKAAAQKTTGVLGDDLALNAQQVSGVSAERELPVVWAVAKGSMRNKAILVPLALAISALAPWAVLPLLMLGGAYLCFEGFEKVLHSWQHRHGQELTPEEQAEAEQLRRPDVDLLAYERDKISGAIRTDFILSAEIITITLGLVAEQGLATQLLVLSGIAVLMTVGVYGLVAAIVKLDDAGLYLSQRQAGWQRGLGGLLLSAAPKLMRLLAVLGTVAMFMVGGGILGHGLPGFEAALHHMLSGIAPALATPLGWLAELLLGVLAGGLVLAVVSVVQTLFGRRPGH